MIEIDRVELHLNSGESVVIVRDDDGDWSVMDNEGPYRYFCDNLLTLLDRIEQKANEVAGLI